MYFVQMTCTNVEEISQRKDMSMRKRDGEGRERRERLH